uniref:Uncharacterized protein n=1 Tax=Rhizophora mucronata TaxID=61149 RepID=A0A2P2K4N4_RHIMU
MAKGLDSLEIPQTIEFQTVASLREWLHAGGEIYSPGSYVTPNFGSYALPNSGTENECGDTVTFNPELVDALQECMRQLEAEAESILQQTAESLVEGDGIFHKKSTS